MLTAIVLVGSAVLIALGIIAHQIYLIPLSRLRIARLERFGRLPDFPSPRFPEHGTGDIWLDECIYRLRGGREALATSRLYHRFVRHGRVGIVTTAESQCLIRVGWDLPEVAVTTSSTQSGVAVDGPGQHARTPAIRWWKEVHVRRGFEPVVLVITLVVTPDLTLQLCSSLLDAPFRCSVESWELMIDKSVQKCKAVPRVRETFAFYSPR